MSVKVAREHLRTALHEGKIYLENGVILSLTPTTILSLALRVEKEGWDLDSELESSDTSLVLPDELITLGQTDEPEQLELDLRS